MIPVSLFQNEAKVISWRLWDYVWDTCWKNSYLPVVLYGLKIRCPQGRMGSSPIPGTDAPAALNM